MFAWCVTVCARLVRFSSILHWFINIVQCLENVDIQSISLSICFVFAS